MFSDFSAVLYLDWWNVTWLMEVADTKETAGNRAFYTLISYDHMAVSWRIIGALRRISGAYPAHCGAYPAHSGAFGALAPPT
jgi:hypothetical protein